MAPGHRTRVRCRLRASGPPAPLESQGQQAEPHQGPGSRLGNRVDREAAGEVVRGRVRAGQCAVDDLAVVEPDSVPQICAERTAVRVIGSRQHRERQVVGDGVVDVALRREDVEMDVALRIDRHAERPDRVERAGIRRRLQQQRVVARVQVVQRGRAADACDVVDVGRGVDLGGVAGDGEGEIAVDGGDLAAGRFSRSLLPPVPTRRIRMLLSACSVVGLKSKPKV